MSLQLIVDGHLQKGDVFKESYPNQPTLIGMLVMLAVDAVLYCAVALLLEFVLSGSHKHSSIHDMITTNTVNEPLLP